MTLTTTVPDMRAILSKYNKSRLSQLWVFNNSESSDTYLKTTTNGIVDKEIDSLNKELRSFKKIKEVKLEISELLENELGRIIWLSDGWDWEWSIWINVNLINKVKNKILALYSEYLFIWLPDFIISPSNNWTVIVSWLTDDYSLSIEFYNEDRNIYYSFIKWAPANPSISYLDKSDGVLSESSIKWFLMKINW